MSEGEPFGEPVIDEARIEAKIEQIVNEKFENLEKKGVLEPQSVPPKAESKRGCYGWNN